MNAQDFFNTKIDRSSSASETIGSLLFSHDFNMYVALALKDVLYEKGILTDDDNKKIMENALSMFKKANSNANFTE